MRVLLGRRRPLRLEPYTGPAYCGCRLLHGDIVVPCPRHAETTGKHREDDRRAG